MAIEIERRFLVAKFNSLPKNVPSERIEQGYLCTESGRTVRIRVVSSFDTPSSTSSSAFITVKGKRFNATNREWEYEIPFDDGTEMLSLCKTKVSKTRIRLGRWEVDIFRGANNGLIIAEIELDDRNEEFDNPSWLGKEITDDQKYSNARLSEVPFATWKYLNE